MDLGTFCVNKFNRRSLGFRLAALYAAVLSITFLVIGLGIIAALRQSVNRTVDRELRARLQSVRLYVDGELRMGNSERMVEELKEEAVLSPAATNLRIIDFSGNLIYGSPGTENWKLKFPRRQELGDAGRVQTVQTPHRLLRILSAPLSIGVAQLGLPLDPFLKLQKEFFWIICIAAPIVLALAAAGGWWMSRRALLPINQIATAAENISIQSLSQRLPVEATGDEVERLSAVLNSMLSRLELAFQRMVQFTADASHELRTPVAILRTTAEVSALREQSAEENAFAWQIVSSQVDRMSHLIADLLTLSRADSGVDTLSLEPTDICAIVADACREMSIIADIKPVRLHVDAPCELILLADSEAIHRAVVILLDNAIKATANGGYVQVRVHAFNKSARISVQDTGIGIAAKHLPHLFERFYRIEQDRSRDTGGNGLGLAIARSIALQHGGEITVSSEIGGGSIFEIQLPLRSRSANNANDLSGRPSERRNRVGA